MKYLKNLIRLMQMATLYPIHGEDPTKTEKILNLIWIFISLSPSFTTFVQLLMFFADKEFDLVEHAMTLMSTTIYSPLFLNVFIFQLRSGNIRKLVKQINEEFVDETDNIFEDLEMKKYAKQIDFLAYLWIGSTMTGQIFLTAVPLFANQRQLPLALWIPYDLTPTPRFELTYLWQFLAQISVCFIYSIQDISYPVVALLITQQFKILASNFKNSFYQNLSRCGVPKNRILQFIIEDHDFQDIFDIVKTQKFQKLNSESLKKNIKQHQRVLDCCQKLNNAFSLILLAKNGSAVFYIIFITFSVVVIEDQAMLVALSFIGMLAVMELFIYTYSGELLTESAFFVESLYNSPWHMCSLEYKKHLLFVFMRINRLTLTKAGNYFVMSAQSLIAFLRAIGSYVAVLNTLIE